MKKVNIAQDLNQEKWLERALKNLDKKETILSHLLVYPYDAMLAGKTIQSEGVLVATDRRLIFFLGPHVQSYSYSELDSIHFSTGIFGLYISLAVTGKSVVIFWVHQSNADQVDTFIQLTEDELTKYSELPREKTALPSYPEDSVGTIMTREFLAIPEQYRIADTIHFLRNHEIGLQSKYYLYVVDSEQRLRGIVPIRKLLWASKEQKVVEVMSTDLVFVGIDQDRDVVTKLIEQHSYLSLPVVDTRGVLVGIVTADDVMDVMEAEATEDFYKMASIGSFKTSLKDATIPMLFRKRIGWLLFLVFMNIFSGAAIAYYEDTIAAVVALVFFLPLLVDSGGNAGSQAATLMVRALATGDVQLRDWTRFLGKEVAVAGLMGLAMGAAVATIGFFRAGPEVALVVALTMIMVVLVGSVIGMSLPFALSRMRLDPAIASAPLITSIGDIFGVLIYFSVATWYLGAIGLL
ncbi:magnesium transporter [Heliorestis convoluta]|uniref:Magnesium transporter MgtE n=1 Tax=Heliorestis convoluta TaxID=356322 RepID=A0A5Q2MWK4_9FIRM|nr:magnesium transporter [Heliorestis convoluta]QGG46808.1 magnesium transporter [Heliorestis convoluta]